MIALSVEKGATVIALAGKAAKPANAAAAEYKAIRFMARSFLTSG